jgi:hypothetical protein
MDLTTVRMGDVELSRFGRTREELETRLEIQRQKYTGTKKEVEIYFNLHVFAIEVKGAGSNEFRVSVGHNNGLTMSTKSHNGLLVFEDVARKVDEVDEPRVRYMTGETEGIVDEEKYKAAIKPHEKDIIFAGVLFPYKKLPLRQELKPKTYLQSLFMSYPKKFVQEGQNAYVNFSHIGGGSYLVFDKPIHGEIEILAHTYRDYQSNGIALLV